MRCNRHRSRDHRSSLRSVITGVLCLPSHHGCWSPSGTSSPRCCPTGPSMIPRTRWAATSRGSRTGSSSRNSSRSFGCSYVSIADCTCGATTIRERRNEWIKAGIFADLKTIARESYDRMVGLALEELAVDGCITKAPGGGECAGPSPVDRRKLGMKRSLLVEGYGIPLGRVLAPANRHDSPLLAPTLDKLGEIGPLPGDITVHLDAGYDSQKTRDELGERNMTGEIAHKGDKAPIQAGQRWQVERTNSWHNGFSRLQRCYERN